MKTTVIIGGNMWQAKQELRRRIAGLPLGSIERATRYGVEMVNGDRFIVRSGQDRRCLEGVDHKVEIVKVGQLELIRDEVWERIFELERRVGS